MATVGDPMIYLSQGYSQLFETMKLYGKKIMFLCNICNHVCNINVRNMIANVAKERKKTQMWFFQVCPISSNWPSSALSYQGEKNITCRHFESEKLMTNHLSHHFYRRDFVIFLPLFFYKSDDSFFSHHCGVLFAEFCLRSYVGQLVHGKSSYCLRRLNFKSVKWFVWSGRNDYFWTIQEQIVSTLLQHNNEFYW